VKFSKYLADYYDKQQLLYKISGCESSKIIITRAILILKPRKGVSEGKWEKGGGKRGESLE